MLREDADPRSAEAPGNTARVEWLIEHHAYVYKGFEARYAVLYTLDDARRGHSHRPWREAVDGAREVRSV